MENVRIQTGGFDKWSCKCNLSNIVGDACAKSRLEREERFENRRRNDKKKEKINSKICAKI